MVLSSAWEYLILLCSYDINTIEKDAKMKANYLVILNYGSSEVITIRLNREQKAKAKTFVNFEDYVESLENDFHFRFKDCSWMVAESLYERKYL